MKPMKQLPPEYFQFYADEQIGVSDRSYSSNWRDYGFARFQDYLKVLTQTYAPKPTSVFECGSADGSVMRELNSMGIRARGVEFTKSILKGCDSDTRKRIARANAVEVLNALPDNCYDCVYETCAQYIPRDMLLDYFKNIRRIVRRDLVIVLHTMEEDPEPHTGQLNHWSGHEWIKLLAAAGFENAYSQDKCPPFYFRKSVGSTEATSSSRVVAKSEPDVLIGLWTGWNIIFPDSTHKPLPTTTGIKGTVPAKVLYDDDTMTYRAFTHTGAVTDWRPGFNRRYGGRPEETEVKLAYDKRLNDGEELINGLWSGNYIVFKDDKAHAPIETKMGIRGTSPALVIYSKTKGTYRAFTSLCDTPDWRDGHDGLVLKGDKQQHEIKLV